MLDILNQAISDLPVLLTRKEIWKSLYIDYHPPLVERAWTTWKDDYRIYLHRIHPCIEKNDALYHPHPWPSAMEIVDGEYEMGVGYEPSDQQISREYYQQLGLQPPIAATFILRPGTQYEMVDPLAWHYVRPLSKPAHSIMVTGRPFSTEVKTERKKLRSLTDDELSSLMAVFHRHVYESA